VAFGQEALRVRLRFLVAGFASVAVIVSIGLYRSHVSSREAPCLDVSPLTLVFGALMPGAQATRTLKLMNSGRGTLIIHKVEASCSCTGIKLDRQSLAPDEVAELRVTMKGKAGGADAELRITSNDPARPATIVKVTSIDGRSVVAEPAYVEFRGRGGEIDHLPVVVRLLYRDSEELARQGMPKIRATSNALHVEPPANLDSRSLALSVAVKQPSVRGMLRGALIVENSTGLLLSIPVTVHAASQYYLPLPAVIVKEQHGQPSCVLTLHGRSGACQPARLSVRTDIGRWTILTQNRLNSENPAECKLEVSLSSGSFNDHTRSPSKPEEPQVEHLIVDAFDEHGRLLESIWVPINDGRSI